MSLEEKHPRVAVGAVVVEHRADGPYIVLIRRKRSPMEGQWTLPGGKVQRGESLSAALAREILEECGLSVGVQRLLEVIEIIDESHHFVVLDYECSVLGGTLCAGDDASEACWVAAYDLAEYRVTEAVARVISRAIADERE
ncbi:MAG: NUDIX domain-containing protein [Deltaproteobacteria bacterium]|nr:NUDIX domain-containing protein [Deltaproteobacteria bacterium]